VHEDHAGRPEAGIRPALHIASDDIEGGGQEGVLQSVQEQGLQSGAQSTGLLA